MTGNKHLEYFLCEKKYPGSRGSSAVEALPSEAVHRHHLQELFWEQEVGFMNSE